SAPTIRSGAPACSETASPPGPCRCRWRPARENNSQLSPGWANLGRADQRFELGFEVALHVRAVPDGAIGWLAVLEDDHGRDRGDAQRDGRRRVLIDVHLHDGHAVAELPVELLDDGGDHPARAAPR